MSWCVSWDQGWRKLFFENVSWRAVAIVELFRKQKARFCCTRTALKNVVQMVGLHFDFSFRKRSHARHKFWTDSVKLSVKLFQSKALPVDSCITFSLSILFRTPANICISILIFLPFLFLLIDCLFSANRRLACLPEIAVHNKFKQISRILSSRIAVYQNLYKYTEIFSKYISG